MKAAFFQEAAFFIEVRSKSATNAQHSREQYPLLENLEWSYLLFFVMLLFVKPCGSPDSQKHRLLITEGLTL
jgi:hypothetical protein